MKLWRKPVENKTRIVFLLADPFQVAAGTKRFASAGDQDSLDRIVPSTKRECLHEQVHHVKVQRVVRFGPVEGHFQNLSMSSSENGVSHRNRFLLLREGRTISIVALCVKFTVFPTCLTEFPAQSIPRIAHPDFHTHFSTQLKMTHSPLKNTTGQS